MAFPQFINDEDPVNNYDDDGTYIRYSSGLGAAVYAGNVPIQFGGLFFKNLFDKFYEMYGTEKPARIAYYLHDSDEPVPNKAPLQPTEGELMYMLQNYKDVSPGQREMLNIVLDVKKDIMQFIGESEEQTADLTDVTDCPQQNEPPVANATDPHPQQVEKEKRRRRTSAKMDMDVRDAIRFHLDNEHKKITQKEVEQMYDLPQGTLSRDKWADVIADYRKRR